MVDPLKIIEVGMKTTAYDQVQNVIAQHLAKGCIILYTVWRFRKCIDDGT